MDSIFLFLKTYFIMYLAAIGLSCSVWTVSSSLQCADSLLRHVGSSSLTERVTGRKAAAAKLLSRFSRVRLCATPETAAHQAPPSLGFSRQEHWSGLPFPSPMHESEIAQSCLTLSNPMGCSPPGSSVRGIFQARVLEWSAIAFSRQKGEGSPNGENRLQGSDVFYLSLKWQEETNHKCQIFSPSLHKIKRFLCCCHGPSVLP